MKKLLLSLFIVATLLSPFSIKAEITNEDVVSQIKAQIEALQIQLQIQMLLEQIASLQAQIAEILKAQASQTEIINSQNATIQQIAQNTTPPPPPPAICNPIWQCSNWSACSDSKQTKTCSDINNCGVADKTESQNCVMPVKGCMDKSMKNYNSNAVIDDGSCVAWIYGCTTTDADNYLSIAEKDDGSCKYSPKLNVSFDEASDYLGRIVVYIGMKYGNIQSFNSNNLIKIKINSVGKNDIPNGILKVSVDRSENLVCNQSECSFNIPSWWTNFSSERYIISAKITNFVSDPEFNGRRFITSVSYKNQVFSTRW